MRQKATRHQKIKDSERAWHLFDARKQVLGRLSTQIAKILMGKHKVGYSPQWDQGDNVVVVNAALVKVTGRKEKDKIYYRHTGYPGGIKEKSLGQIRKERPTQLIRLAVKRMLPKGRLGHQMIKKLYLFANEKHGFAGKEREFVKHA